MPGAAEAEPATSEAVMNNHSAYPNLSMDAGRIQALLDGWNAIDVAAFASADEFAEEFYDAEFVVDPAADGRDDDLDAEEILQRARQHWQACRTVEEQVEASRLEAIDEQVEKYPGFAREVWGGWVFCVINSQGNIVEQRWSKARTQAECHQTVYNAVELHGFDGAFDFGNDAAGETALADVPGPGPMGNAVVNGINQGSRA